MGRNNTQKHQSSTQKSEKKQAKGKTKINQTLCAYYMCRGFR